MFIYTVYMFIYFWYLFVILLAFLILGVIEKHVLFAFPKTKGRHVFASFLVSSRHYHALKQMTKQHDMPYGSSLTFLGHVMLIYYILECFLFTIWIYPIVNYSL